MKNTRRIFSIALCLLLMLSLCACGSSGKASQASSERSYSEYAVYDYDEAAVAMEDYGGFAAAPMAAQSSYSGYSASNASMKSTASGSSETGSDDTSSDLNPEKIIYSADATVETTEFDATISALEALIEKYGGWVESSSVNGAKYSSISRGTKVNRSASYTVRVPNEKFSTIMSELSSLGNVPYSHVYTENVTSQYYDTQARLKTYEAQEQRLMELLDKAETVSDVIEIENELTDVRYRIESLQTTLRGWDRRVSWSTISLSINEVSEYTPVKERTYGEKLAEALSDGLDALADLFVGFVEALPVLAFFVLLLVILILIIKNAIFSPKRVERRKARAEAKAAKKAAAQEEKK